MTAFRVTPAELMELSRQVHGTAGSIEAELGGLRSRVAPIGATWNGQAYVACLVAQDVQEALLETVGRWPLCSLHEGGEDPHELRVTPDLGPDPQWMCEEDGCVVAPVGALSH